MNCQLYGGVVLCRDPVYDVVRYWLIRYLSVAKTNALRGVYLGRLPRGCWLSCSTLDRFQCFSFPLTHYDPNRRSNRTQEGKHRNYPLILYCKRLAKWSDDTSRIRLDNSFIIMHAKKKEACRSPCPGLVPELPSSWLLFFVPPFDVTDWTGVHFCTPIKLHPSSGAVA